MGIVMSTSLGYFNGLKTYLECPGNAQDKGKYEKFLEKISKRFHTGNRVNRFVAGSLVELLLKRMLENAFPGQQFQHFVHQANYVDIGLPNNIRWSVKTTFCFKGDFRLTNTMGQSNKSPGLWKAPTIFFLPGTGIVYANPRYNMKSPSLKVDDDCVKIPKSNVRKHADNKKYVIDFDVPRLSSAGLSSNHVEQMFVSLGGNNLPKSKASKTRKP